MENIMENINEYIGLIVAIVIVIAVIILQIVSFIKTQFKIREFGSLFDGVDDLFLKETSITPSILRTKSSLQNFLKHIPSRHEKNEEEEHIDYTNLSLIDFSSVKKVIVK